jgi:hypothetical protein
MNHRKFVVAQTLRADRKLAAAILGRLLQPLQQGEFFERRDQCVERRFRHDHERRAGAEYSVGATPDVLTQCLPVSRNEKRHHRRTK